MTSLSVRPRTYVPPRRFHHNAERLASNRLSTVRKSIDSCRRVLNRRPNDVRANARMDCLAAELLFLESLFAQGESS